MHFHIIIFIVVVIIEWLFLFGKRREEKTFFKRPTGSDVVKF